MEVWTIVMVANCSEFTEHRVVDTVQTNRRSIGMGTDPSGHIPVMAQATFVRAGVNAWVQPSPIGPWS